MNKILKYVLIGTVAVVGIAAAGIAYVVVTFNPNDYKPQIIQAVQDSKQRKLRLDGEIKLSFFPSIGANLSMVSLSEFRSEQEFASIENAHVSLALLPLLSKQVVINEVAVSGMKAQLVKQKDGKLNIDDFLSNGAAPAESKPAETQSQPAAGAPVRFDIASVSVDKTALSYRDEASGAQYAVKDLSIKTGRVANRVPVGIEMSVVVQANQPKLDVSAQLKTTFTFDLERSLYHAEGIDMQVKGGALDFSNLNVKANGEVSANLSKQEFDAKKLTVSVSGTQGKNNFDARLNVPALSLTKDQYSADKVVLNAKLNGAIGNIVAALSLPGVEGNAQSFKISALTLEAEMQQPEQAFKVKLTTPVAGNIETQQFSLPLLVLAVNASGDKLPNKSVSSELQGSVQLDAKKQAVAVNLAGGLLQSQIKAKVDLKGFAYPAIKFDVDVDQLDADLYLPKTPASSRDATSIKSKEPEQALDLSALRNLNLNGSLRIGALKVMNVKSTQLRVDVKALNGLVNINPLSAKLYQGSVNGSLSVNAQATPSIAIIQNLGGINVGPLAKDAAGIDMLEGKGNIGVSLTTQGNTVSAMKKALNGNFSLNLADGAIKGIDIDKKLLAAQAMLNKGGGATSETQTSNKEEKTAFKEFKATFRVTNGVAHNDDLSLRSELVRVSGAGDINIGNDSIDYVAKAAIAKTPDGKGGIAVPLHVSGPYTDLKFTLDYAAMVKDVVKQKVDAKVEAKKEDIKAKTQEQLKSKLKGLFK